MRIWMQRGEFLTPYMRVFLKASVFIDFIVNLLIVLNINPLTKIFLFLFLVYFWGVQP